MRFGARSIPDNHRLIQAADLGVMAKLFSRPACGPFLWACLPAAPPDWDKQKSRGP